MPRPLIVKIVDHKPNPQKVATGSIDVQLLKETSKSNLYGLHNHEIDYVSVTDNEPATNSVEEPGTGSLVRSLISKYETSRTRSTLMKHKSKSLSDLVKPEFSIPKRIVQDDSMNSRQSFGASGDQPFDFKRVWSKFETSCVLASKNTSAGSQPVYNNSRSYKHIDTNSDLSHFGDIKHTVKTLLQTFEESRYNSSALSLWQSEVVEFLKQISTLPEQKLVKQELRQHYFNDEHKSSKATKVVSTEENSFKRPKSLESGDLSKSPKVKEIKNMFEIKSGDKKPLSRSVSEFTSYFTGKPFANGADFSKKAYSTQNSAHQLYGTFNSNTENDDVSDDDWVYQDTIESGRIVTNPVMASTIKIQELKGLFESNKDNQYVPYEDFIGQNVEHTETEERMLPPPKIITLDDVEEYEDAADDIGNSKLQIEELVKDIADFDNSIENLSGEDKDEGSYINEALIRILIRLDDVKTYGDGVIQTERRKAIQFVQNCITKLREKIRGHE